jgi:hypothetical protein
VILRRLKGLLTVLCDDVSIFDSALCQKLANCLRCDNPLPRIKGGMEIGAKLFYGSPPGGRAGLEHAGSPGRDRELAASPHHAPQFTDLLDHVGDEENREHAHYGIERIIRIAQIFHVCLTKRSINQFLCVGFCLCHHEQPFGQICTNDATVRSDGFGSWNG